MARDYKNAPKPREKARKKNPFAIWIAAAVGALFAVLVMQAIPKIWQKLHHGKDLAISQTSKPPTSKHAEVPAASTANEPPHFDFYKLLPSFQVVIPSQDKETRSGDVAGPVDQPGTYILQVGSFQSFTEADKLKANLALLGIESNIQAVKVSDGSTWNRVRIGPIHDLKSLNSLRAKLAKNHIEPLVIKTN